VDQHRKYHKLLEVTWPYKIPLSLPVKVGLDLFGNQFGAYHFPKKQPALMREV
jgi:hypothetical protein